VYDDQTKNFRRATETRLARIQHQEKKKPVVKSIGQHTLAGGDRKNTQREERTNDGRNFNQRAVEILLIQRVTSSWTREHHKGG